MANRARQYKLTTLSRRCAELLLAQRPAFLLMEHSDKVVWHNYAALLVDPQWAQQEKISNKSGVKSQSPSITARGNQANQSLSFMPQGRSSPTELRLQFSDEPVHLSCVCTPYLHDDTQSRFLLCIGQVQHALAPQNIDQRIHLFAQFNINEPMQFAYTKRRGKWLDGNLDKLAKKHLITRIQAHRDAPMDKDHVLFHQAGQIFPIAFDTAHITLRYAVGFKDDDGKFKNRFFWFQDQMYNTKLNNQKNEDLKKITAEIAEKSRKKIINEKPTSAQNIQSSCVTPTRAQSDNKVQSVKNMHELVKRLANASQQSHPQQHKPVLPSSLTTRTFTHKDDTPKPNDNTTVAPKGEDSKIEKAGLLMLDDEFTPDEEKILAQIEQFKERMRREKAQHGPQNKNVADQTQTDQTQTDQTQTDETLCVDEDGKAHQFDHQGDENMITLGDNFDDDLDVFEADDESTKKQGLSRQFNSQKKIIEPNPAFEKLSSLLRNRLGSSHDGAAPNGVQSDESTTPDPADTVNVVQFPSAPHPTDMSNQKVSDLAAPVQNDISILDRLPLALMIYRDNRILFANRQFIDLVDFPSFNALQRLKASQLWPSAPHQPLHQPSMQLVKFDGTHIPVNARLQSVFWRDSQALLLTAQKYDNNAPLQKDALDPLSLCKAADLFGTAIAIIDEEAVIKNTNHNAQILLHQSANISANQNIDIMLDAPSLEQFQHYFSSLKKHQEPTQSPRFPSKIFMPSGDERDVFLTIGAAQSDPNMPKFYFLRLEDSTNQKIWMQGAKALEKQNFDLSARHADMLLHLGHDIRTPLTTIIGFAQLLKTTPPQLQPVQVEKLDAILGAGDELRATLKDIVHLHALEIQTETHSTEFIDLLALLRQNTTIYRERANDAHVVLRTNFAADLGYFDGNAENLNKILDTVLAMAIKRSPIGRPVILSAFMDENGVTINMKQEADFEPVSTGDRGDDTSLNMGRNKSGAVHYKTAFSFAIAKAMAEADGCRFTISPAAGVGTLYSLNLPQNRLHQVPAEKKTDA